MRKLRISLIFNKLVVFSPIITIIALMHNFIVKLVKSLDIFKKFAGRRVNSLGNVPRRGAAPKFSDLEVMTLFITAKIFGINSETTYFIVYTTYVYKHSQILLPDASIISGVSKLTVCEKIRKDMAGPSVGGKMFPALIPSL